MHLKSLTLRGFKSFASSTTLRFEPGITCVVGPNGSGKSNVVDGIAWVLGEQGAKALRGGKMEDVIFAGTAGRAPLGRAEVTLTIDNHDGALPIEYTEVSITRRLFRTGDSEYEINGDPCRLLDIQELLSDSGIGREMHVIVGQGQLDSVLQSRPEDRRGFIEEAAGVLKHRKRKEKALRKLDAMQANLTRLTDLTAELRRQLKPLGRQAEVARRAAGVQSALRDSRLRLLADDLVTLRTALEQDVADEAAVRTRRTQVDADLETDRAREAQLDAEMAADAPVLARAQDTWYRLSALQERFRGLAQLADERLRYLSAEPEESRPTRDPEALEREAAVVREQHEALTEALEADQDRLAEATEARAEYERRAYDAERAHVAAMKAVADRREGLARLTGQVNALRTRATAAEDEIARLSASLAEARGRADEAQGELDVAQEAAEGLDEGDTDLFARHAAAREELEAAEARVRELTQSERVAEREASEWKARQEALALGLSRKDGAGALLGAGDHVPGLLGSVSALLSVEAGYEAALAAALGALADAVAVASVESAADAIEWLRSADAGRATLLVSSGPSDSDGPWPILPDGSRWAVDLIKVDDDLRPTVRRVLHQVAFVPTLDAARALISREPGVRAITPEGDVVGALEAAGGAARAQSALEIQAAVDDARDHRAEAERRGERLRAQLDAARAEAESRKEKVRVVAAAQKEAEGARHQASRRIAELAAAARSARGESDRLAQGRQRAEEARDKDLEGLAALEERLVAAEETPLDDEPSTDERDEFNALASQARQNEMEVRLAVRTAEERVRSLAGRAESLERAAASERAAQARAAAARASRARGASVARAVSGGARVALGRIETSLVAAADERDAVAEARVAREAELTGVRARVRELAAEMDRLTDAMHRDEVARAEQRMRIEQLESKAADDFAIDVDTLANEYGPQMPVPPTQAEIAEAEKNGEPPPAALPYHRPTQEKRAAKAERDLQLLGKVNPLALEEFAALEERFKFLSTQLEDLKDTRRDLLLVVKEVDDRILEVFKSAFEDTQREFEIVFRTLFPGGEGRIFLTDPDDLLMTGIEVEARPPGKKVKRLSLLSGGERSLTAVALLVAIFRARPSPFYVMDEVEAALDDTNLGRLITLLEQLQDSSQLIIITHQKRTMEIADALYGVSMRGDGITQVISQRLKDTATA
ncbi:chromosome segregation protein SMC [Cryptosporangium phraense]|uniref:Chromosome partition protein Smc n=1 Tax=Cryptosporangium phraense TaxID=2593070 RepID=A0A545ASQ6_9ACTN|nr:chromosome segregation protein SMC [Cryptosporangium phraense]TQS44281.1 chromosome segregation protein SMC [Cryptosporangium phraense]